jgi:hypothetical protein
MTKIWPSFVQRARFLAHGVGPVAQWARRLVQQAHPLLQRALPLVQPAGSWVRRARSSVQHVRPLVECARSSVQHAPQLVQRARPSARFLGEIALGALLLAALAFSPRDAVPSEEGAVWPQPGVRLQATFVEQPMFGLALPGLSKLAAVARASGVSVSTQALIPTAPPVQLLIPTLNVHRAVERVGTNRFGVMDLPVNGWNAGWYKSGPVPGAPGDAVIEGHAGYPDQPMLFGKLVTLRPGAQIVVVLSDGTKRLFEVVSMSTVPAGVSPPGLAQAYGPPRLTLVTCTGHFDADNKYYAQRLMVEARYVGLV